MLGSLRALLGVIVDIILLRRGPEHVPASPALLAVVIAVYAVGAAITGALFSPADQPWALELVVAIVVTLAFYQIALNVAKKRERFTQTMTAMFAVRAIFTPLLVPMMGSLMSSIQAKEPASSMLALLFFAGVLWVFVVDVRIMRSAFEWPTPAALLLVIAQQIVLLIIAVLLLGGQQPPPA
jgi:surface polysaccharide O-acyltransferase-like enzyme